MPNRREVLQQLFAGAALLPYSHLSLSETVNNPPPLGRPFPRSPLMSIPDIVPFKLEGEPVDHGANIPEGFGLHAEFALSRALYGRRCILYKGRRSL